MLALYSCRRQAIRWRITCDVLSSISCIYKMLTNALNNDAAHQNVTSKHLKGRFKGLRERFRDWLRPLREFLQGASKSAQCIAIFYIYLFKAERPQVWRAWRTLGSGGPKGHAEPSILWNMQCWTFCFLIPTMNMNVHCNYTFIDHFEYIRRRQFFKNATNFKHIAIHSENWKYFCFFLIILWYDYDYDNLVAKSEGCDNFSVGSWIFEW